jgi:uncharacterized protein (TIGR03083 family)
MTTVTPDARAGRREWIGLAVIALPCLLRSWQCWESGGAGTAARCESPPDGPATTLQDAAAAFARTLRAAGPNQPAEFSGITLPTAFWARRATHDLVIHRADVAYATGVGYAVDLQLAVDTIDELLENVSPARPDFEQLQGADASIHLHATDTGEELTAEWYVESGPDGLVWRRSHQKAAIALRGPLVDVLTVFYRRQPVDGSPVEALGSRPLVDRWLDRVNLG